MKRSSLVICAFALLAVAVFALFLPGFLGGSDRDRPGHAQSPGTVSHSQRNGNLIGGTTRGWTPGKDEVSRMGKQEDLDFETDEEGIVDPSAYDADQDGQPDIARYLAIYRKLKGSAGKCDMLQHARILEPPDDPALNEFFINEAARSEDPEIRRAARDAIFEYGGPKASAALADYIATQTGISDLEELKLTLDRVGFEPLRLQRD